MSGTDWYDVEPPVIGTWWWAVEHLGHPAFYLRALLPGDFAPGRQPLDRHALTLGGNRTSGPVACGTCQAIPRSEDLDVIERSTGARSFLEAFRSGRRPWPRPTEASSCWECCARGARADREVEIEGAGTVHVCSRCAAHLERTGGRA